MFIHPQAYLAHIISHASVLGSICEHQKTNQGPVPMQSHQGLYLQAQAWAYSPPTHRMVWWSGSELSSGQGFIGNGRQGVFLTWQASNGGGGAIVAFNIIGWAGNQTINLITSVSLLIGGCSEVKGQGQACHLEVQICWGTTWKLVLDSGFFGSRCRPCWWGNLETAARYRPVS